MSTAVFAVGDLVTPDPSIFPASFAGCVYRITKVPAGARGVNYTADRADGSPGRGIRGSADVLRAHDPDAAPAPVPAPASVELIELHPTPPVGAVVIVTGVAKMGARDLYVVTGEARRPGCVRLSRLGGDPDGRYWPSIPARYCTVVTPADIAGYL